MVKNFLKLNCLIISILVFSGCYCKTRSFEIGKDDKMINLEGWDIKPIVRDLKRCGETTRVTCYMFLKIKLLDNAFVSLQNELIGVRIDTLDLIVNGIKTSRSNSDTAFFYPKKANKKDVSPYSIYSFRLINWNDNSHDNFPDIPEDIKQIRMNAIISFRNENTNTIQTKVVSYVLVQNYERSFIPDWLFGY